MTSYCERRAAGTARMLGDNAQRALGDVRPDDLHGLLQRRAQLVGSELELARQVELGAEALGLSLEQFMERIA